MTTHCRDSAYWYQWSEDQRMFVLRGGDEDEDGHVRAEPFEGNIMGDDCDDYEPNVYPGNTEIPYDGLDTIAPLQHSTPRPMLPTSAATIPSDGASGRHEPSYW